jgi:hypothetical protein
MKIAITGHTSGLGKAFFDHWSANHEVIGLSRSSGHDISKNRDQIVETVSRCDLFFNNAHCGICQAKLLSALVNKLPIITSGSMGSDYAHTNNQYYKDKKTVEIIYKTLVKKSQRPLLLLKMGYLENYKDKQMIPYQAIIHAVEFWLINPRVTMIEFDNIGKHV